MGAAELLGRGRTKIVLAAALLMLAAAAVRMPIGLQKLLWEPAKDGAVDLRFRHEEVERWFAGAPVYPASRHAIYPPASYPLLWLLCGWLEVAHARVLAAFLNLSMLALLAWLAIRISGLRQPLERLALALILPAMYATCTCLWNGQLTLLVLAALMTATALARAQREPGTHAALGRDLACGLLLLFACIKPSIAAPFLVLLVLPGRQWRPALLVVLGYLGLSLLASSFQPDGLMRLSADWLGNVQRFGRSLDREGYGSLYTWTVYLGAQAAYLPLALGCLALFAWWLHRHRTCDLWLLFGITALMTRLWTYHRVYDDLLVFPALVSLLRLGVQRAAAGRSPAAAMAVLAMVWLGSLAPARLQLESSPWHLHFELGQAALWLGCLVFLMRQTPAQEPPGSAPVRAG